MRVSAVLDGLLVVLDQVVKEGDTNLVASPKLKEMYTTCKAVRKQLFTLRHTRIKEGAKPLGWDELMVVLGQILLPILKYREQTADRKPSDISISMESIVVNYMELPKKINEYFKIMSEFSENVKPLDVDPAYTFDSLVGSEREKTAIKESFMYPDTIPGLFPQKATGAMFYGVPGTGKNLMIKAMVTEFQSLAFVFAPTEASLRGPYEGETQQYIHALYDNVSAFLDYATPKIHIAYVVIDEAENLLGSGRGSGSDSSKGRSVGPFLQVIDGAERDPRIITIILTNHPDVIDSAILRRLPARIRFDMPGSASIKQIVLRSIKERYLSWTKRIVRLDNPDLQMWSNFKLLGHSIHYLKESDVDAMVELLVRDKYSPSDITKGMVQAFNRASARALEGVRQQQKIGFIRPGGGYGAKYLRFLCETRVVDGERRVVYAKENGKDVDYSVMMASLPTLPILMIPSDDPSRLPIHEQMVSFEVDASQKSRWSTLDFRLEDFRAVFVPTVFRPSVTQEMTQAIADFESRGID